MFKMLLEWISSELQLSRDFKLNKRKCFNCEYYQEQLENERAERVKLTNKLLDKNVIHSAPLEIDDTVEWQALQNNARSRVNRAILSRQSFARNEQNRKEFEEQKLKSNG